MKNLIISLSFILMFLFITGVSLAHEKIVYQHPTLNIQFEAPSNWKRLPRPEDRNTYELVDPDGSIHVMVWHTTTEQSARRYLLKMASMKDLVLSNKDVPEKREIKGHEAFVLDVPGFENKKPVQTLLAVIPHGKSIKYPKENYLFLIQIWCPERDYKQNKSLMVEIFDSMEIK